MRKLQPIQRPLINSSNADAYRLTLIDALDQAAETRRQVAEWATLTQEQTGFDRGPFLGQLSSVLGNRQGAMREMLDAALEWRKTDVHYATVFHGNIHDSWESGGMVDRNQLGRAGRIKLLWIKSDDEELTERAHTRINQYALARGYDMTLLPWR